MTSSQRQKETFLAVLKQRNEVGRYLALAAEKGILDLTKDHYRARKEELDWANAELESMGAFDHAAI